MKNIAILSLIALVFLLAINQASANSFTYYYVGIDDGTANHLTTPQSFLFGEPCNVSFTEYATIGSSPSTYTSSFDWYSPDGLPILNYPATYTSNISCLDIGTAFSSTGINNSYTTKTTMTTTATGPHNTWTLDRYECNIPANEKITLAVNSSTPLDFNGYWPYDYQRQFTCYGFSGCSLPSLSSQVASIIYDINKFHYALTDSPKVCNIVSTMTQSQPRGQGTGAAGQNAVSDWQIVRLFNFYSSKINFSILSSNFTAYASGIGFLSCNGPSGAVYLYDPVANTSATLTTSLYTTPYNVEYTINRNQEYWLLIEGYCSLSTGGFGSSIVMQNPRFNLTINSYQPDLNCSSWGNCTYGQHTRYCNDLNNKIAPFIESESCIVGIPPASYTVPLGFDKALTPGMIGAGGSYYCGQASWPSCERTYEVNLKARLYPQDWYMSSSYVTDDKPPWAGGPTTGLLEDFIDMSDSFKYGMNGYSLKMWYIPRKTFLPTFNQSGDFALNRVLCNETKTGRIPMINRYDVGTSLWISRNITALTKYMKLQYRAVRCDEPELQMTGGWGCYLACNLLGNCASFGVCSNQSDASAGKDYYTWTGCYEKPRSTLSIVVSDISVGGTILRYTKEINATNWEEGYEEDILSNLSFNHTYEITIGVPPLYGVQDKNSYCTYIDDMNVLFRDEEIPCSSGCLAKDDPDNQGGYTYRSSTNFTNGCAISYIHDSPYCTPNITFLDIPISKRVENHSDWCDFTVTPYVLHRYDDSIHDWTYAINSQTCIDEKARQDQIAATAGYQISLYFPPFLLQDFFNLFGYNSTDWGILWFFFSTFMLINYVAIGLGILAIEWTKSPKQESTHWELALAVMMLIIFGALFSGYYPLEIGIPAIAMIVLLLANKFGGGIVGHRGGG